MRQRRSHYNTNRVGQYNAIDARIDNPHATRRELPGIVRQVNEIRFRPKGKKVA